MTEELREKLAALRAIAPRLNSATDDVVAVVQAVEKFLDGLSLGVSARSKPFDECRASHSSAEDDEGMPFVFSHFAYGRVNGRHQFHIVKSTERKDDADTWEVLGIEETPWSSAPREIKLASFEKMPELLDKIADRSKRLMERAVATTGVVKEVLDAIGVEASAPAIREPAARTPILDASRSTEGKTVTTARQIDPVGISEKADLSFESRARLVAADPIVLTPRGLPGSDRGYSADPPRAPKLPRRLRSRQ